MKFQDRKSIKQARRKNGGQITVTSFAGYPHRGPQPGPFYTGVSRNNTRCTVADETYLFTSGLAPENLDRLFDAFYTTKANGMGMGLSICRSIIDAHGGRLWASANEPRGAVFQFTAPANSDISF